MVNSAEINALGSAGSAALNRRNFHEAAPIFERLAALTPDDRRAHLGLAMAKKGLGDFNGAHAAIDAVLRLQPRDLPALLLKADYYAEQGDQKAAAVFYQKVVSNAPPEDQLPPEASREIARAKSKVAAFSEALIGDIRRSLEAEGYDSDKSPWRFTESIEILSGRRRRFVEEPTSFFYAGLPAIGFYPREMFPWLADLEAQTEVIAEEFASAVQSEDDFVPYVRAEKDRPIMKAHPLLDSMDWSALFLIENGRINEAVAERFPKTLAVLEKLPLDRIEGKCPMALFSRLRPHTHLWAHSGFLNIRLICHLPIITPGNCRFRVGDETREWRRGEAFVFNDSINHEAWNDSDKDRVILLFSIWRPELEEEEKRLISALMNSAYGFDMSGAG